MSKKTTPILEAQIRCSGHLHKIGVSPKGQLMFFNHTKEELQNEKILYDLTGIESSCACYNFLILYKKAVKGIRQKWGNKKRKYIGNEILQSKYIKKQARKHSIRVYERKEQQRIQEKNTNFKFKIADKIYWETNFYNRLYNTIRNKLILNDPKVYPQISIDLRYCVCDDPREKFIPKTFPGIKISTTKDLLRIDVYISIKWYLIYKKGFATVDGNFVLNVKQKISPTHYIVQILKIEGIKKIYLQEVEIKQNNNGKWHIIN